MKRIISSAYIIMLVFMSAITVDYYLKEMHKEYKFLATWPPGERLNIGDVGIMEKNLFHYKTNLSNLGIGFGKIKENYTTSYDFANKEGVAVYSKFGMNGMPSNFEKLDADIVISFQHANTIYFKASKVKLYTIDNINLLERELISRYKEYKIAANKEWNIDWVVITELHFAEKATILISKSNNSYLALNAEAGTTPIDILNLNCNFAIKVSKGVDSKIIAENGITPLFNGMRLIQTILGGIKARQYLEPPPGEKEYEEYKKYLPTIKYRLRKIKFQQSSN